MELDEIHVLLSQNVYFSIIRCVWWSLDSAQRRPSNGPQMLFYMAQREAFVVEPEMVGLTVIQYAPVKAWSRKDYPDNVN